MAFKDMTRAWLRRIVLTLAVVGLTVLAVSPDAHAQAQRPDFGQFKHRRWTADDGAPFGITDIVQTPDGYLWLSADALYRFDGVTFERIAAPAGSPMERAAPATLMVSRAGELWVGFRDATGVAVYRNGGLQDMKMPNPPRVVARLAQTADGAIWTLSGMNSDRLRRFANGRWEQADETFGLPAGVAVGLSPAPNGDLWIPLSYPGGASGGLAYLPAGAKRFQQTPYRLAGRPRAQIDGAGALWLSDATGTRKVLDRAGKPTSPALAYPSLPDLRAATIAFDREGGLWGTTESVGIFHIPAPTALGGGKIGQFRAVDGLTSDIAFKPLIDREGSVWIATELGIDQFRPASALQEVSVPAAPAQGLSIAAAKDGSVYLQSNQVLFRALPGHPPREIAKTGSESASLCAARDGGVWHIQGSQIAKIRDDHVRVSGPPPPGDDLPISCAEDRQGRLWVTLSSSHLAWRDEQGWHQVQGEAAKARVWDMVTTPAGDLAATIPADLATMTGDRYAVTKLADFKLGYPTLLAPGVQDLFVGGSGGLLRVRGIQIKQLDGTRFPWAVRLRGLVQTPQGETWLVSPRGVARIATSDLDRAFDDPGARIDARVYDSHDGLTSTAQHVGFAGIQVAVGGDGRVWFLNREGAAYFDPLRLQRNALPPPVAIRWLASGGKVYRDPKTLVLPPGSRSIEIAYAGLSLAVPQRVQFRYRLEGVDADWVDPGSRRLASYSNLGPGRYRFRVIAANNDGTWNNTGATLDFEIRPTFFQAWPFKALCGVALLGLLWLAYRLRMRVVTARIRARMAERVEERERIARDLHDTLLQSVQTLTLRFQLAVDDLPKTARARPALEAAIDRADEVIAQGRNRVHDLRSSHDRTDLEPLLADIVAAQAFDPGVVISVATDGAPRALAPLVLDEVGQIASEAIFNVWRHANASRLTIETRYGPDFSLRVADDGAGIDPQIAERGKDGHFGVVGMRERASKLRGELRVRRLPEGGTEVTLTLPGAIAYATGGQRWLARLGIGR
ncbi:sensor histidine kinase [Caulobacter soli]|uniref:sensor histidine kinase n=1 Tax=Caulobacter soli TaxID=2708539 RepID=UPI0013EC259F|nr:sensor histidine kinase [Caulobacter soli]